jgi:uncharacterized membrane protein (GlpM family)
MLQLVLKYAVSAGVVVAVAEISKRSSLLAGLLASLPLTSVLAFLWLYRDTHDVKRVAALSQSILWLVLPSLALFMAFPPLLRRGLGFYSALSLSIAVMLVAYGVELAALRFFGTKL